MKNSLTIRTIILRTTHLLQIRTWKLRAFTILAVLALFIGCDTKTKTPETEVLKTKIIPKAKVHVAFAGGGWRAYTGHSGWTISLLDGGKRDLQTAFANVGTMASNSGGSWFSTMLMYSDSLATDIQRPNAIKTWGTTGWLGKQRQLFTSATCSKKDWWDYFPCIYKSVGGASGDAGYWNKIIEDIVFRDYPVDQSITLSSPHLPWAKDKPLLLAASLLTSEVVLNEKGLTSGYDKRFYQACMTPSSPSLNAINGSSCSHGDHTFVMPVTFSSMPIHSIYTQIPFLSAVYPKTTSSMFNLGYTENWYFDQKKAPKRYNSFTNPLDHSQVPVVIAAATSSAAMGFAAMNSVAKTVPIAKYDSWGTAYELSTQALSFQLKDSIVKFVDVKNMNLDQLNTNKVVRIADGGPVDNSGVAQLVSFLQKNKKATDFNIVAFDNVETSFNPDPSAADIGVDLANLFGQGLLKPNEFCIKTKDVEICVNIPDIQIFEAKPLTTTQSTWEIWYNESSNTWEKTQNKSADYKLVYTQYKVKTKDNSNYNIKAGSMGTLHSFSCIWKGASTAPFSEATFDVYDTMLSAINSGLLNNNAEGLKHLEKALGL